MRHRPPVTTPRRLSTVLLCLCAAIATAGNRPARLEAFRDRGLGLFIHWSLDSQLGSVISHSLVGASDDYVNRYIVELPRTFKPHRFDAGEWASLAKLAGFTYVVFTTKHHSGFCMFHTETTTFGIQNTPFGRDLTRELVDAFRKRGLGIGFYFSPDDFYFLYTQGTLISRRRAEATPQGNPALMEYDKAQLRELLTRYGPVDVMFLDGPSEGLAEVCWELQPDVVVTRGAMTTPEQVTPGIPLPGAWEGNLTMGTQWQYKPTNEHYKTGTQLIEVLIETRAKGGNLLLNVGPKPDGTLPIEQEALLRELALWNFVNREAVRGVRPWIVTNEGRLWFTKKADEDTVFAAITRTPWRWGTKQTFTLRSILPTAKTAVSVLGQNDKVLEYRTNVTPATEWHHDDGGLHVSAWRAQRLYNDRTWPNPVVLKITHATPGLVPPVVITTAARWDATRSVAVLTGELRSLGEATACRVGFQYRRFRSLVDLYEPEDQWRTTELTGREAPGAFTNEVRGLAGGVTYEIRALVKHPAITMQGDTRRVTVPKHHGG
jgi:alpha-L-fucosidase